MHLNTISHLFQSGGKSFLLFSPALSLLLAAFIPSASSQLIFNHPPLSTPFGYLFSVNNFILQNRTRHDIGRLLFLYIIAPSARGEDKVRVRRNWLVRTILFPCLFPFTLPFLSHSLQRAVAIRRNPFYYRSSFKLMEKANDKYKQGRNPFYYRSSFKCEDYDGYDEVVSVAIPSITGLRSNAAEKQKYDDAMSQSLLLQVFVQMECKREVFRVSSASQSLLLQVFVQISPCLLKRNGCLRSQSLLLQVFVQMKLSAQTIDGIMSQSLLLQVFVQIFSRWESKLPNQSQSLLLQVFVQIAPPFLSHVLSSGYKIDFLPYWTF